MISRWGAVLLLWLAAAALVAAEETPTGLVAKDSEQDLVAEATHSGAQAQKREAGLSNSYGEPIPADSYGPPKDLLNSISDLPHPVPVYGVPELPPLQPPPGAYGPPAPITFPSQTYHGPPPPIYKPKPFPPSKIYGPPKHSYGPPKLKPVYGPPKKIYGPPKQSPPKLVYGVPFKPPKFVKPIYGPPKPVYGPPKPIYGPPARPLQLPELPQLQVPPVNLDLGLNLPAPIYGTPLVTLPVDLKPNFPIPSDSYGPPGDNLGSNELVFQNIGSILGHYGPPQPDANPRPPHPGIPAPPTPPHVLYDGWKPIPGLSKQIQGLHISLDQNLPNIDQHQFNINLEQSLGNIDQHQFNINLEQSLGNNHQHQHNINLEQSLGNIDQHHYNINLEQSLGNNHQHHHNINSEQSLGNIDQHQFNINLEQSLGNNHQHHHNINSEQSLGNIDQHQFNINLEQSLGNNHQQHHNHHNINSEQSLGNIDQHQFNINVEHSLPNLNHHHNQFDSAEITSGYSNIHHDALANIDLNAIVDGDSNHIDQSKTVFEAHYTENNRPQSSQQLVDSYSAPPLDSLSNGPYPPSVRQQGAKGLVPPSGIYGVPPGSQYGAPPKFDSSLPIPYGQYSGGGHTGGHTPHKPIKFRESVPEGLLENIGQTTRTKDTQNHDHVSQGIAYLPPPIRDVKDTSQHTGHIGLNSVSLSIEPTDLYSLPHSGNPISFQQPSNLYGSPIDSYSAPLLTVGDHISSGSHTNSITSTVDGTVLANLSSLDAAAILKHCPYHEAILRAAKYGQKIPADLASTYVASLSSLGTTLNKANTFSDSFAKDLTASHSVIHNVYPENQIKKEKSESYSEQNGKSPGEKHTKDERFQFVSDEILKTSERIKSLSEEAKVLQQKIVSSNQRLNEPVTNNNNVGYSVQIQSSNDQKGKSNSPTIPHDQLLSEGLLQSILQAIEDPATSKRHNQANNYKSASQNLGNQQSFVSYQTQSLANHLQNQHIAEYNQNAAQNHNFQQSEINLGSFNGGLDLPAGYEPVDHTKDSSVDFKHGYKPCDLKSDGSIKTEVIVPPPKVNNVKSGDDDVAIFFNDKDETVTEISVATSISEGLDFGEKVRS